MKTNKTFLYLRIGAKEDILNHYNNVTMTVTALAEKWGVTPRTIQRFIKANGGNIRTVSEANKVTSKLKDYSGHRVPEHLKVKRNIIKRSLRYKLISEHPFCVVCASRSEDGIRLEIDHIDNNPSNNSLPNLQVLCMFCNQGKR